MATLLYRRRGDQLFDNNGEMLEGGKLYYYEAGTTHEHTTFSDVAGTVPNTNPLELDAFGRLQESVYFSDGVDYKELLTTSEDVTIAPWPIDDIPAPEADVAAVTSAALELVWNQVTAAQSPVLLSAANAGQAYECDTTAGSIEFDFPAASAWTNQTFWFKKAASANSVILDPNGSQTIDDVSTSLSITQKDTIFGVSSNGAELYLVSGVVTGDNLLRAFSSLSEDTAPVATADFLLAMDTSATFPKKVKPYSLIVPGAIIAIIEDRKAQNTDGGTFTSGADRTRTLNTLAFNRGTVVSLAGGTTGTDGTANQFVLPAGTWEIIWNAPGFSCDQHQTLLYDVTGTAELKRGTPEFSNSGSGVDQTRSFGRHVVTIGSANTFEIRHRCQTTRATNGLGSKTNFGVEIYSSVVIRAA